MRPVLELKIAKKAEIGTIRNRKGGILENVLDFLNSSHTPKIAINQNIENVEKRPCQPSTEKKIFIMFSDAAPRCLMTTSKIGSLASTTFGKEAVIFSLTQKKITNETATQNVAAIMIYSC